MTRWWLRFADAAGAFLEEAAARVALAWAVLRGKSPKPVEKRWWNRSAESPALLDVYSWVDERLIFSALIWPSLETNSHNADRVFRERVREVQEVVARGAAEKMWSTRFEVDYGLTWDHRREVWVDGDGHRYDGSRFGAGSKRPSVMRGEGAIADAEMQRDKA